jgi:hypothetical protein
LAGVSVDVAMKGSSPFPLTRFALLAVKLRAVRRRVWFRVLSKVERSLIDLAIEIVRVVRSSMLARSVIFVVKKLLSIMESKIARQTRTIGFSLAQRLSQIAQNWGNKSSVVWALDPDFAKFLAIDRMNTSTMSKG